MGLAYGVEYKTGRAYELSLFSGDVGYLAPQGRGPKELMKPVQITQKNVEELLIYDNNLNVIAYYHDGEIQEKFPGYSEQEVWVRNLSGFYWENKIISGIVDFAFVQSMDFEHANAIGILDYREQTLSKVGDFSSTVDDLDAYDKFPFIFLYPDNNIIFYVFRNDYTIMAYDLERKLTYEASDYKPSEMRIRSLSVDIRQRSLNNAKQLGLDKSVVIGLDHVGERLVVVWQNFRESYYENPGNYSADYLDFFGVVYDLPEVNNPREFTLPGRFFGTYKDMLLIEEEYGSPEQKIGFYEFVE